MKHPLPIVMSCLALFLLLLLPAKGGELDGIKVSGTFTNIIGLFDTYGQAHAGDTFELDLGALPKEKLTIARPNFNPDQDTKPYLPLSSPLIIDKIEEPAAGAPGAPIIFLSSKGSQLKIQVMTSGPSALAPGNSVRIYFYQEAFGRIICMAEAKGVLK